MAFDQLATDESILKTVEAIKPRNVEVIVVENKGEAFEKVKGLIPAGASVMNGSSTTLHEIGFVDYLKAHAHGWNNLHDGILAEKDPVKQMELRRRADLADYFLGSVHAITEEGQLIVASASGSQMPAYAFTAKNVIWVAGTQKIVKNIEDGMQRIREYVLPLEDARMKSVNMGGSSINKWFILEKEPTFMNRKLTLILVKEKLGF